MVTSVMPRATQVMFAPPTPAFELGAPTHDTDQHGGPAPPPPPAAGMPPPVSGSLGAPSSPSAAAALPLGLLALAAAWRALVANSRRRPGSITLPELAPPG
ncbi:MAG: hypothetical protein JO318_10920 [Chloroflexi bacterium]|nr:hypothetical protein [Chloroflexota bacterium]